MQYVLQGVIENPLVTNAAIFTSPNWSGSCVAAEEPGLVSFLDGISRLDGRMHILVKPDGTYLGGLSEKLDLRNLDTCLDLIDGVICATRPEFQSRLKELLTVEARDVRTLILPCSLSDGHVIIRSTAISPMIVCLSLHRASEEVQPELADLQEVFNLTHAESLIMFDLFMGRTPQEIAVEHNNSIHTIRAHIRRCYDKLGITCREELWRKLNAYRLA